MNPSRVRAQGGWSLLELVAAIVVVGLGISLFVKVHGMSHKGSTTNSRVLVAGKMIEKYIEDTRIAIISDTLRNWPPLSRTIPAAAPSYISLTSTVTAARSPKDGATVRNVMRLDIVARWTNPHKDSLQVTTYVAKRF